MEMGSLTVRTQVARNNISVSRAMSAGSVRMASIITLTGSLIVTTLAASHSVVWEGSREPSTEAPGARTAPGMNATALMFYFNARLRPSPRVFE